VCSRYHSGSVRGHWWESREFEFLLASREFALNETSTRLAECIALFLKGGIVMRPGLAPCFVFGITIALGWCLTDMTSAFAGGGLVPCTDCVCKEVAAWWPPAAGASVAGYRTYDSMTGISMEVATAKALGVATACAAGKTPTDTTTPNVYLYEYFTTSPSCDTAMYNGVLIEYSHSDTGTRGGSATRQTCQ
jgi:hypothetical protein